jgi:hypothetical protein
MAAAEETDMVNFVTFGASVGRIRARLGLKFKGKAGMTLPLLRLPRNPTCE